MSFAIEWNDSGREPKFPPNPNHPDGIHVDATKGEGRSCTAILPYPAQRCGIYVVTCEACGYSVAITTAGRTDDPRSVKVSCLSKRKRA